MRGVGKRLKARGVVLNLADAEVARRAHVEQRAYSNYVNDKREPDFETLRRICDVLGISPNELLGFESSHVESAEISAGLGGFHEDGGPAEKGPRIVQFDGEQYAAVVRFDLYASAGPGAQLPEVTEIRDRLLFKMEWLRGITRATIEEVACLSVVGDSMEPALRNGDVVLVDMTQNNPARDDIYVIRRDGLLLVKRLQKSFKTKTLTIISDNPKYGAEEGVNPEEVQVIGRVFWMGRKM